MSEYKWDFTYMPTWFGVQVNDPKYFLFAFDHFQTKRVTTTNAEVIKDVDGDAWIAWCGRNMKLAHTEPIFKVQRYAHRVTCLLPDLPDGLKVCPACLAEKTWFEAASQAFALRGEQYIKRPVAPTKVYKPQDYDLIVAEPKKPAQTYFSFYESVYRAYHRLSYSSRGTIKTMRMRFGEFSSLAIMELLALGVIELESSSNGIVYVNPKKDEDLFSVLSALRMYEDLQAPLKG